MFVMLNVFSMFVRTSLNSFIGGGEPLFTFLYETIVINNYVLQIFRSKLTFFAAAKVSSSFPPPDLPEIAFAGSFVFFFTETLLLPFIHYR